MGSLPDLARKTRGKRGTLRRGIGRGGEGAGKPMKEKNTAEKSHTNSRKKEKELEQGKLRAGTWFTTKKHLGGATKAEEGSDWGRRSWKQEKKTSRNHRTRRKSVQARAST